MDSGYSPHGFVVSPAILLAHPVAKVLVGLLVHGIDHLAMPIFASLVLSYLPLKEPDMVLFIILWRQTSAIIDWMQTEESESGD
jgi:hypothetical protein